MGKHIAADVFRKPKHMLSTRGQYIRRRPDSAIVKFSMGERSGAYTHVLSLFPKNRIQVRGSAIEAARVSLAKDLEELIPKLYFVNIRVQAHIYLRKRQQMFGPQADRLGQSKEYGSVTDKVVLLSPEKPIFDVYTAESNIAIVKDALKSAGKKLPCTYRLETTLRESSEVIP